MNSLSKCLTAETAPYGIIVQTVTPNQVDTKMAKDMRQEAVLITPKSYVKQALRTVGHERITSGHYWHKFVNNSTLLFADLIGDYLFSRFKFFVGKQERAKYLKTHADITETS